MKRRDFFKSFVGLIVIPFAKIFLSNHFEWPTKEVTYEYGSMYIDGSFNSPFVLEELRNAFSKSKKFTGEIK